MEIFNTTKESLNTGSYGAVSLACREDFLFFWIHFFSSRYRKIIYISI